MVNTATLSANLRRKINKRVNNFEVRNVMVLNELSSVRVNRIEPVAHVVSNLLVCWLVLGKKDSPGQHVLL